MTLAFLGQVVRAFVRLQNACESRCQTQCRQLTSAYKRKHTFHQKL